MLSGSPSQGAKHLADFIDSGVRLVDTLIPQEISFGGSVNLAREFSLKGLKPGVTYYYFISVWDESGNQTQPVTPGEFHTRAV